MSPHHSTIKVFSGNSNPELAADIASRLSVPLSGAEVSRFSDGEISVQLKESVRGFDVFIVQSIAGENLNDMLMELLIMTDAAKRASARTVTAVVTHYAYARQDRKAASREPITAKLVANLMEAAGVDRTITIDLHQGQIQGFFDTPVNHITAMDLLVDYFRKKNFDPEELCVVSPDMGRAKAAKKFSQKLGADVAIIHKDRPRHNQVEVTALIGDVKDKICILNDDMIDTGGSIVAAANTLKGRGAKAVYVCATHPVFSGPAYDRLENADVEEVVVTNTIPVPEEHQQGKIKVISIAPLFARAIQMVFSNGSVSSLGDSEM